MSPLVLLLLVVVCVAAAGGTLYRRELPGGAGSGSELAQLTASTNSQCGIHCQRAGTDCVGFHWSGAACRLFSTLQPGLEGTFVRQACIRNSYRILPPMTRDAAKAACAAKGGRMAIPITAEDRTCVQALAKQASEVPGFNPPNLDYPHVVYLGVLVHGPGPAYTFTDLENNPLELPADVWDEGQPNDNRDLAYVTLVNDLYTDWHTWGVLMNVCEVGLSG